MKIALFSFLLAANAFALSKGDKVPAFQVKNQDGTVVTEKTTVGKPTLYYFYPKDETPGCTKQACTLRDEFEKFRKMGAVVYGISKQDEESHKKFKANHKLPFDLLADTEGTMAKAFGIETIPVVGLTKRESVLVAADGKVLKTYKDVVPGSHAADVIKDLQELSPQKEKTSGKDY